MLGGKNVVFRHGTEEHLRDFDPIITAGGAQQGLQVPTTHVLWRTLVHALLGIVCGWEERSVL